MSIKTTAGIGLYVLYGVLALGQIFNIVPANFNLLAILLSLVISIVLLLLHLFRPDQQRAVGLFLIGIVMIFITFTILIIFSTRFSAKEITNWVIYLVSPYLPLALLFPIIRKRMPGIELRANQAFINALFVVILSLFALLAWLIFRGMKITEQERVYIVTGLIFAVVGASLYIYPVFKRWAQKYLLGIPMTTEELLQRFSGRIATSPEKGVLAKLLQEEVMPALMVRQMTLLHIYEDGKLAVLVSSGLDSHQIPSARQIPDIVSKSGKYFPPDSYDDSKNADWTRLVLKLEAADQLVGVCLLGQRDPDDFYSADEIPLLQSLMNQTALALYNIEQAERIHAYHQSNIQRNEEERNRLSRDLHDDVLGQLALIQMNLPKGDETAEYQVAFSTAVARVRRIMNGLKPAVLEYGLYSALQGLAEELNEQAPNTQILNEVLAQDNVRYPREVETHVFRIVQEACQNAIRHGQAGRVTLYGTLQADQIQLILTDNGKGFIADEKLDLNNLLKQGHFGLVNIYERALMIGAKVDIQSVVDQGTSILLDWKNPN